MPEADRSLAMLADATPMLQDVINDVGTKEPTEEQDLVTMMREAVADIAVNAYMEGVDAMVEYPVMPPQEVADRLRFRAEMARSRLKNAHGSHLRPTIGGIYDEAPTYLPFIPAVEGETPEEFTDGQVDRMTGYIITALSVKGERLWDKVSAELAYQYGKQLIKQGVEGVELERRVWAFECKQLGIMRSITETKSLSRPEEPNQDFNNYLDELYEATVMLAETE